MRINGRTLRASDLRERRVLVSLGIDPVLGLRVPRTQNPYHVARCIRRVARAQTDDVIFLKSVVTNSRRRVPGPSPELDVPAPVGEPLADAAE